MLQAVDTCYGNAIEGRNGRSERIRCRGESMDAENEESMQCKCWQESPTGSWKKKGHASQICKRPLHTTQHIINILSKICSFSLFLDLHIKCSWIILFIALVTGWSDRHFSVLLSPPLYHSIDAGDKSKNGICIPITSLAHTFVLRRTW